MLGGLCGVVLYYALLEGRWGTVGKAVCRLRVVGPANARRVFCALSASALCGGALPHWIVYGSIRRLVYQSAGDSVSDNFHSSRRSLVVLDRAPLQRLAAIHDLVTNAGDFPDGISVRPA
jgi:hypothetical protein